MSDEKSMKLNDRVSDVPLVESQPWQILIVDDEPDVIAATQLILGGYRFDGRPLMFFEASSAEQARSVLRRHRGIALVLLDVVMETEDAGLQLVEYIRSELNNSDIRIVLQTGQPGNAPEQTVILDYEINDYLAKTELTLTRLHTVVTAALRGYRDYYQLQKAKQAISLVLEATAGLQANASLMVFGETLLAPLSSLFHLANNGILALYPAQSRLPDPDSLDVVAVSGHYWPATGARLVDLLDETALGLVRQSLHHEQSMSSADGLVLWQQTAHQHVLLIFFSGASLLLPEDRDTLKLYSDKIQSSVDNFLLHQQLKAEKNNLEAMVSERTHALTMANERLAFLANYDELTGLKNRRCFYDSLSQLIDQTLAPERILCVAILDIDHFKKINDRYGHPIGDEVLMMIGGLLRTAFSAEYLVSRFGGEEFVISTAHCAENEFAQALARFQIDLSRATIQTLSAPIQLTVSIGYAVGLLNETAVDALLKMADIALYQAKENGRNKICRFDAPYSAVAN